MCKGRNFLHARTDLILDPRDLAREYYPKNIIKNSKLKEILKPYLIVMNFKLEIVILNLSYLV